MHRRQGLLPPSEPEDSVGNCTRNSDCGTGGVCDAGNCVECGNDTDCGQGFVCDENSCRRGCIRDEACGALSTCNGGHCEARDCQDDRECVAFTGRPDGVCAKSGKCSIPCDNDGGCAALGPLLACVEGSCTYAGCQTNAECAAADDERGFGALSLCLEQAEAAKITFSGR